VRDQENVSFPARVNPEDLIFQTDSCVNTASVENIHYLVYVDSEGYHNLPPDKKLQVARAIGRINGVLQDQNKRYILIGPGRWGSNNIDLGVKVTYADIDAAAMIVEIATSAGGYVPEASYGTHFFQDLVEDGIYYLAVYPGLNNNYLSEKFFHNSSNLLKEIAPDFSQFSPVIRVVSDQPSKSSFRVAMDRKQNRAVCYCVHP
jgi:hypothetical protein